jgi:hypothetical protein
MNLQPAISQFLRSVGPEPVPPEEVVLAVVAVVVEYCPWLAACPDDDGAARRRLFEIVVAYGCGFHQVPILGFEAWAGVWPRAFARLNRMVEIWVAKAAEWLDGAPVLGFERARRLFSEGNVASAITTLLVHGGCRCFQSHAKTADGKPVPSAADSQSNRDRRLRRCLREHLLLGWRPAEMGLCAFVARAVKGSIARLHERNSLFTVGALVQGMFYGPVSRETGLRAVDALVWRCARDRAQNFYGMPCRVCLKKGFDVVEAGRRTRLRTMRWLILPSDLGGGFSPANFRRCQACECYFPASRRACPWDGTVPGRRARSSVVWIPTEGRNVELDAASGEGGRPMGELERGGGRPRRRPARAADRLEE